MNDFSVRIAYHNRSMENVGEETYDFKQYSEMLKRHLMKVIVDVEDIIYYLEGGKPKEEWNVGTVERFQRIRHKLLDQANAIERLPQNLYYKGINCMSVNLSEIIAREINALN